MRNWPANHSKRPPLRVEKEDKERVSLSSFYVMHFKSSDQYIATTRILLCISRQAV